MLKKRSNNMGRKLSILPTCLLSLLLILHPFSSLLYADSVPRSVKLIYKEPGKQDEECQIIRSKEKEGEIEIVDDDPNLSRTEKCDDLKQILVPRSSGVAGNMAAGAAAGGCIGATIGALFFGIGIIPGAMIGVIFGSSATAVATDKDQDVKSEYCLEE